MKLRKKARRVTLIVLLLAATPAIVRAYTVAGPSMAPTLRLGDRVIALLTAYDLRLPYTDHVLFRTGDPRRGDVIVYHDQKKRSLAIKRIVGLPGDTIELSENRLRVNATLADQKPLPAQRFNDTPVKNQLGDVVASESIDGQTHSITYTPGKSKKANHPPTVVPEEHYFLLGDHRDNSADSRFIGCIERKQIKGRVFYGLRNQ